MSDNNSIDLPVTSSGADGIERIVSAIDRLHAAMTNLGNNSAVSRLEDQMKVMQASITAGFAGMAGQVVSGGNAVVAASEKVSKNMLSVEQRRDVELDKLRQADLTRRVAWWNKVLDMQERRDAELNAASARAAQEYTRWWEKAAAERLAIEQRRDIELHTMRSRERSDYESWWKQTLATQEAGVARQIAIERARDVELHAMRQRAAADAAGAAERQRTLNTNFLTSGPTAALGTAQKAAVYASQGGNAVEKYGSAAASADIRALTAAHEALQRATAGSRGGVQAHNEAMREAHSLARGLTGSLGGLWLTYGSLVPLAAGAAISASLKAVVESGRDVEYQLKFVQALGGGNVNLDSFLKITDATVVSVKEAAEGMRALAQNGLNATESLQALPSVLNLAVIGELSVANAALSATGTLSAFGMKLQDIDKVGDIFAQAAATSNTSVAAMTESMRQASTVAAVYGSTIEETAAALGVLAKINVTGSAAGTAYTNMLTNLYSPTKQAAAALKELGISTDDGMGGLKNSTQLLTELRTKLSQFNAPARADILGDIFTVRGQKAASTIIENLDLYMRKIDEAGNATGYMGRAVATLEDSTTGAFKRLANSASDSLNRAFASSSPALQELTMHLAEIARSDGTVKLLTAMGDATLRVVKTVIEFSGVIAVAVAGLVAMRMVGGIATMLGTYSTASLAAATATQTLAARMALLNASLGWIGLAVAAAVAVWQIFISTTSDVEKADTRMRNSIQANIEYIERETEALKERNKAWNPETQRFDKKVDPVDVDATSKLSTNITNRQTQIDLLKEEIATGLQKDNLAMGSTLRLSALEKKQAADKATLWKMTAAAESLAVDQSLEGHRKEKAAVLDQIDAMVKKGQVEQTLAGSKVALDPMGNEKSRAVALTAVDLGEKLKAGTIDTKQAKIELLAIEQQYNSVLSARAAKPDAKTENAELAAALKRLDLEMQLARLRSQSEVSSARGEYARGEIGDLQLIQRELQSKIDLENKAVSVAQRQYELADAKNKAARMQEYQNRGTVARATIGYEQQEAADRTRTAIARMQQETVAAEAKALADRGQLVDAFNLEYETKYGETVRRTISDWAFEEDAGRRDVLANYLLMLTRMETEGRRTALGKQLADQFKAGFTELDQILDRMQSDGEGGSIGAMFTNALAAEKALEAALPGLIAKQREMQANAVTPDEKRGASKALAEIDAAAARTRSVWVTVGKAIEKSLGDAFGKGGKAAGQLFTATASYFAKQKEIQANLARDTAKDPTKTIELQKKATEDLAANQVRSYGDMAGAAKGFFSENSRGYEALTKVQNIFRAAEMVLAIKSMATQLFATQTVTTAKVTGAALENAAVVSTVPVTLAAEGTKQTAYGVSALASALAAPFPANLAAFAAVAAMLAAIGVVVSGGGGKGKSISEERQEKQGTGTVLGSPKAKSESISRALDRIESNTYQGLSVSTSMLDALRGIQNSIGNFAALIVRNSGLTGEGYEGLNKSGFGAKVLPGIGMLGGAVGGGLAGGAIGGAMTMGVIGSSSSTMLGMLGGPIGMLAGALLGAVFGKTLGKLGAKIFGGKQTVEDTGFTMARDSLGGIRQGGVSGYQFADIKKDGGWFRSDKHSTQLDGLGADANRQFTQVITSMADGIMAAGSILGIAGGELEARLNAFSVDIGKISLKDMDADEIQQELESVFSKLGDDMASWTVQGMEKFAKIGEGPLETLTRMAQEYATIDVVFQSFGKTFGQIGMASLEARARLIELSGGLEEFVSQGQFFLENFYTEAEQREKLRARIAPTLAGYGVNASAPDAMMQLRKFVESLDVTSEYGARAYATLMQVAPALKEVADAAGEVADQAKDLRDEIDDLMMTQAELRAKERNELDATNRALYDQLQAAKAVAEARDRISEAYDQEKSSIEATIDRINGLADSWKEFRNNLIMGDKSTLTPQQKYAAAQAKYEETLAAARGGDTKAQDAYQSVAEALLDASRVANASGANYTRDFDGVLQDTEANEAWARREVDVAKASLDALKTQVEHLVSIDEKIGTVAQELANFAAKQAEYLAAQAAAAAPPPGTQTSTAGPIYGYYEREGKSDALVGIMIDQVEQTRQWREQQAQEAQDAINSNAEEIRRAAEAQAEALRERNNNRQWEHRNEAYER